jgi:hypothetical protein
MDNVVTDSYRLVDAYEVVDAYGLVDVSGLVCIRFIVNNYYYKLLN